MELKPLGLIDRAALQHLQSKKRVGAFSHYDIWLEQHAYAFSVAKMMDEDLLRDTQEALADALREGTGFREFKARLKPILMAKGWWGEAVMTDPLDDEPKWVQLGSTRRLKTIFQTNIATAHAASRWQRIWAARRSMPFLRYNASHAKHKREAHQRYVGLILPVEHTLWQVIFPPNGYGCQCSVSPLTRRQAERAGGVSKEPDMDWVEVENPRTGEVVRVPGDITPSFAHNHTRRVENVLDLAAQRHGAAFAGQLTHDATEHTLSRINPNYVKVVDFAGVKADKTAIERLLHDPATGKPNQAEAWAAAQWETHFDVRLERYPLNDSAGADFRVVQQGVDPENRRTLDFMFTLGDADEYTLSRFNAYFMNNQRAISSLKKQIRRHLEKADTVPMDLRYLTLENRVKLIAYVLSLPREQSKKIVFILG